MITVSLDVRIVVFFFKRDLDVLEVHCWFWNLGLNDKNSIRESGPSLFGGDFNHGGFHSDEGSDMFIRREQHELILENTRPLM